MKKILYIFSLLLLAYQGMGQSGIQNQAVIKASDGAIIKISGSNGHFTNYENGKVDLDGTIKLQGNWINNSSGDPVFINTNTLGKVYFIGSTGQTISGTNYTLFENLYLNNSSGISIGYYTQVENVLSMTNTILDLDAYNLRMGSISNLTGSFGASNMITSSSGGYFQFIPELSIYNILPFGSNNGAAEYSRLYIYPYSMTLGSDPYISARVEASKHPNNASTTNYLQRYWQVSSNDITEYNVRIYAYYVDDDIVGAETQMKAGQFADPFWKEGSYLSTSNYLRYNSISELGDFTAGELDKFQVSISATNETTINEGTENGKTILVTVSNGTFVASPNISNWDVYNLPEGVSLGSVAYVDDNNVRLTLSGNRTVDFDVPITDIKVEVSYLDVNNLSSGIVSDDTGVTILATNDDELLSMTDDGEIFEGSESGETITVTLTGGTFADPIDDSGWELNYLPEGITYSITRTSATTADIDLASNTNIDYDIDNDTLEVVVPGTDIDDYNQTSLSVNSGVTFTAIVEALTLTLGTTGNDTIIEGSEDGSIVEVIIGGDTFVGSLSDSEWSVSNLPIGVVWDGVANRIDATTVQLNLAGNRTIDYDTDIKNLSVQVNASQITTYAQNAIVSNGVVFDANNDVESISFSTFPVTEGAEDGATVSVYLAGGTFYNPLDYTQWSVTNLPQGVSIGNVVYESSTEATITLSGNSTVDYDSNIDFNLSVNKNQLSDVSTALSGTAVALIEAVADSETLAISGTFLEDQEDGSVILATLTNGTFNSAIVPSYFTVSNLPTGVEVDSISYNDASSVLITLIGNASTDYDVDITNTTLVVDELAYDDSDGDISVSTGVTFVANDEIATVALSPIEITEANEDGNVITVNLLEDIYATTMDATNCTVNNLPTGVSVGIYERTSDTELKLTLTGNRTVDFDFDIINVHVEVTADGLQQHNYLISSDSVEIIATDDTEILTLTTQTISEGFEDGSEVEVVLNGGTFAESLNIANWSISNGPSGLSISSLNRVASDKVLVTIALGAAVDYDSDILLGLTIANIEIDDYTGSTIELNEGVIFEAMVEPVEIAIQNYNGEIIKEGTEDGGQILVTVTNDEWVDPLELTDWTVSYLPIGVSVDTIVRISATDVLISLKGNRVSDYDQDIDTVMVGVLGTQFLNQSTNLEINQGALITAINDNESISITPVSITERQEEAAEIEVVLDGGTFVSELDINNWSMSGLPSGVSLSSVVYTSSTTAKLVLTGTSDTDFDVDITDASLTVAAIEVNDRPTGDLSVTSGVTFTAIIEQVSYNLPGGTLTEDNVNESIIELTLVGDEFVDFGLDIANFTLSNTPAGLTLGSIEYIDAQTAYINFDFDRTDFDVDYTSLTITVGADEITSASAITTSTFTLAAVIELPYIVLADNGLLEGSESSGNITVSLYEDTFKATLTPASWQVNNLPLGITVNSIVRVNETTVNIILQGSREQDYDVDILNTKVTALASELTEGLSDVTSSTGVIFIAVNDDEAIDFSETQIFEGGENSQLITLNLSGGTFVSDISSASWEFNNLPEGVTVNSVTLSDSVTVLIELAGTRTLDYDVNIDNFEVVIPNTDVDDFTNGYLSASSGVTFVANNEILSTTTVEILEENLNGTVLTYSLIDDAFVDTEIDPSSVVISNMPDACTIGTISYINDTAFSISLLYNNVDFDTDFGLIVEVNTVELVGLSSLVADEVLISAINDDEIITIEADSDGIFETFESGETIAVTLTGGNYNSTLNIAEWGINNIPDGVAYSITYINDQLVNIELTTSSSTDYDSDYELLVSVPESDVSDYLGNNLAAIGTVLFNAYNENLNISGDLLEQDLDNSIVSLSLSEEVFTDATLEASNIILNNAPIGLSVSSVSYISSMSAEVTLAYSPNDFDSDISDFYITVLSDEIRGNADIDSDSLTIVANVEAENIEIAHGGLTEENIDQAILELTTTAINFADETFLASNFILNNAPAGASIQDVTYLTDSSANLQLAFDGTDFDNNIEISLTILAAELSHPLNITTNNLVILASNDDELIRLSTNAAINEAEEDGSTINVVLEGGQFVSSPDFSLWEVQGLPTGVTATGFANQSNSEASFQLSGNSTVDYDVDQTINLVVPASDINDTDIPVVSSVSAVLIAFDDDEVITMTDDGNISEGAEDGEFVVLTLEGGDFAENLVVEYFIFTNIPAGIAIGSITRNSDTQVTLQLSGNTTADYDGQIDLFLQISDEAILDYNEGVYTIMSGVTLNGNFEISDRVLSIYADELFEETLDGSTIELSLAHEIFSDATIGLASFTLHNAPVGVAIQSVSYVDNTTASLTLSFDGTDFDSDSTNVAVEINGAELASGVNLLSSNTTITASTENPQVSIFHEGLHQGNLNGSDIVVTLKYDAFVDATLDVAAVTLNNAPTGTSVTSFTWQTATSAIVTLSFDGTAFTDNIFDFSVTVDAIELVANTSLVSNNLNIGAGTEASLIASTATEIIETSIHGTAINLKLIGGTFTDNSLAIESFHLLYSPIGVEISSVKYVTNQEANITLVYSGIDFDSDIDSVTIQIDAIELNSGVNLLSNRLLFTAVNDEESIQLVSINDVIEGEEDGHIFSANLFGGTYTNNIDMLLWSLTNLPQGVSIDTVERMNDTKVNLKTIGNSMVDYDTSILVSLVVDASQVYDFEGSSIQSDSTITFNARIENPEAILSATNLSEYSLDGQMAVVDLLDVKFANENIQVSDFTLLNAPDGLSISSVSLLTQQKAEFSFAFDGSDFDIDYHTSIIISKDILTENIDVESNAITVSAVQELVNLQLDHMALNENNLNNAQINLTLDGSSFSNTINDASGITLKNAPAGLTAGTFTRLSDTTATVGLSFDGSDFDTDYLNFTMVLNQQMVVPEQIIQSVPSLIMASIEPNVLISYDGEITEGSEAGELITIALLEGAFDTIIVIDSIEMLLLPQSLQIGNLIRVSDTLATVKIANSRTVDYDTDVTSVSTILQEGMFVKYFGDEVGVTGNVNFTALNENLEILHDGLNQGNLNGAEVNIVLTDDYFTTDQLNSSYVTLQNMPTGVSIHNLIFVSNTQATLVLNFDGSVFDQNYNDFYIELSADCLFGIENLMSNSLVIDKGVSIDDISNNFNVDIYSMKGVINILLSALPTDWEYAAVSVFTSDGRKIYENELEKLLLNQLKLDVATANYFVKVNVNGNIYSNQVFVKLE